MTAGRFLTPFAVVLGFQAAVVSLVSLVSDAQAAPKPQAAIPLVIRCEACTPEQRPSIGLLWQAEAGEEPAIAGLETSDWSAGTFTLQMPGGERTQLQAEALPDSSGWSLSIPVTPSSVPFRVVAALEGFSAERSAFWPGREAGPYVFAFEPVPQVLDENPSWDPARTGECDVLIPKSAATPVAFFVQGQPRAWLYPGAPAADGTAQWTFQFVRPGQGLLERVNVLVPAFDEGGAWSFRLPLSTVLGGGATWPSASVEGDVVPGAAGEAVDEIRIAGAGTVRLSDCPRATR